MRFPIHVPDTADDGRRPVRFRLAALGFAAALTATAALAAPLTATADDVAAVDGMVAADVAQLAEFAERTAAEYDVVPAERAH